MIRISTKNGMSIICSNLDTARTIASVYKQTLLTDTVTDLKPVKMAVKETQKLYCANNDITLEDIVKDNYSSFYNYEMSASDFISEHDYSTSK